MKVLALISGGKDSAFCALRCQQHGHDIVALGNLYPAETDVDDIDSWMFQTAGHNIIPEYSRCTGLPMFRRAILGSSRATSMSYQRTEGDEVEDLAALIAFAKQTMPEIQAVCSGAIASGYQRVRVESVCSRLGLTSLAYLWHEPQSRLLDAMIEGGVHAVLIKAAAQGLKPRAHLGQDLATLRPHLWSLRATFGSNPCGEGGEYETLVLDSPLFTRAALRLDETEVHVASHDPVCPVGLLRVTAYHLEAKGGGDIPEGNVIEVPASFSPTFASSTAPVQPLDSLQVALEVQEGASGLHISCRAALPPGAPQAVETTCAALSKGLNEVAQKGLAARGLTWSNCIFVRLYLRDMAHFASANQVYVQQVPLLDPPSRACVQLPDDTTEDIVTVLRLEVMALRPTILERCPLRTLHVQSISRWAPSCIGPYAQCKALGPLVVFSGVIPLDPPSMTVVAADSEPETAAREQCRRAVLSCDRVAVAMGVSLARGTLTQTVYCAASALTAASPIAQAAREALEDLSSGASSSWDPLALSEAAEVGQGAGEATSDEEADFLGVQSRVGELKLGRREAAWDREFLDLPGLEGARPEEQPWQPLVLYVGVPVLPRGCLVEVEPVAIQYSELGQPPKSEVYQRTAHGTLVQKVLWEGGRIRASIVRVASGAMSEGDLNAAAASCGIDTVDVVSCRLYYNANHPSMTAAKLREELANAVGLRPALVPTTGLAVHALGETEIRTASLVLEVVSVTVR